MPLTSFKNFHAIKTFTSINSKNLEFLIAWKILEVLKKMKFKNWFMVFEYNYIL